MNTCPHCGTAPCLPAWRKLLLGPGASARCRICGYRVTADPLRAWLAMTPTLRLVIAVAFQLLTDSRALVILLPVALAATGALYLTTVPLRPAELGPPRGQTRL